MKSFELIKEPLAKMNNIQQIILDFLEADTNNESDFQNIIDFFNEQKISENQILFNDILTLISRISYNHHRNSFFINKIERILKTYENQIKHYFSNFYIFNIFKRNKRILLFLFKEKIIIPDDEIFSKIKKGKYARMNYLPYFYPEFKSFCNSQMIQQIEESNPELKNFESFNEKRQIGENDEYILHLIRNNLIDEFVSYINRNNISIQMKVQPSIFETNPYLLSKIITSLIDYSLFFGSFQIFQFLRLNNAIPDFYAWLFAVHGKNSELIHICEEIDKHPFF